MTWSRYSFLPLEFFDAWAAQGRRATRLSGSQTGDIRGRALSNRVQMIEDPVDIVTKTGGVRVLDRVHFGHNLI